jgi:multicomponent Na+:H+ antiporter subunit D
LQEGAIQAGEEWVALVLGVSSLLNAAYFLPILYRAWLKAPPQQWPAEHRFGAWETSWLLLLPPLVTVVLVIYAGVFAESSLSPLVWVKLIAAREYAP